MKTIMISFTILLFIGCSNSKINELEKKNIQLEKQLKLVTQQSILKDEFVEEYTSTINEVYKNLEHIRRREGLIQKYTSDIEKKKDITLKEKMLNYISGIDDYLRDSKKQLNLLKERMYANQMRTAMLEETIDDLSKALDEKEKLVVELKSRIFELDRRIAKAENELEIKTGIIKQQARVMNTAYYIIGNKNELKEKGIIEEKGGILGIRKTKKLSSQFQTDLFIAMDQSLVTSIPIDSDIRKVKIISPHNLESYSLIKSEENETLLEIIDPKSFWKIKYLVILTKG
jgi:hypothetical protein